MLLVERFTWLLACFGFFLVYTGGKALYEFVKGEENEEESIFAQDSFTLPKSSADAKDISHATTAALETNVMLRAIGSLIPLSKNYDASGRFFIHEVCVCERERERERELKKLRKERTD